MTQLDAGISSQRDSGVPWLVSAVVSRVATALQRLAVDAGAVAASPTSTSASLLATQSRSTVASAMHLLPMSDTAASRISRLLSGFPFVPMDRAGARTAGDDAGGRDALNAYVGETLRRCHPLHLLAFLPQHRSLTDAFDTVLQHMQLQPQLSPNARARLDSMHLLDRVSQPVTSSDGSRTATATFVTEGASVAAVETPRHREDDLDAPQARTTVTVPCGANPLPLHWRGGEVSDGNTSVLPGAAWLWHLGGGTGTVLATPAHARLLSNMMQDHALGLDVCLVGPPGCGKSVMARVFAGLLGYDTEVVQLYKDMTPRDLCLSRSTDGAGNTTWRLSAVVEAAINGVYRVSISTRCLRSDSLSLSFSLSSRCTYRTSSSTGRPS
jgi:hypothetical protein